MNNCNRLQSIHNRAKLNPNTNLCTIPLAMSSASHIPHPPFGGGGVGGVGESGSSHHEPSYDVNNLDQPQNNNPNTNNTLTSTPYLQSRLQQLKTQSSNLSTELTKKLATSRSGQSLLHIGPSLSTLPPDLSSLLEALTPLLQDVTQYENENRLELEKLLSQGRKVQCTIQKQSYAVECAQIYSELVSAEEILRMDAGRRMEEVHGLNNKKKGDKNNMKKSDDEFDLSDDDDEEGEDEGTFFCGGNLVFDIFLVHISVSNFILYIILQK